MARNLLYPRSEDRPGALKYKENHMLCISRQWLELVAPGLTLASRPGRSTSADAAESALRLP
jgi:hypothetical protein